MLVGWRLRYSLDLRPTAGDKIAARAKQIQGRIQVAMGRKDWK